MKRRYGLDAICYLTDPPPVSEAMPVQPRASLDVRRKALRRGVALKQRELASLKAQLDLLGDDESAEFSPDDVTQPGLLRRLMRKLFNRDSEGASTSPKEGSLDFSNKA